MMLFLARMSLYRRFLLCDRSQKATGTSGAYFLPVGDTVLRVMGAECWLWESGAARESGVKSSHGLQRVLCRHVHCLSLDQLLGPSLARTAGVVFKFFWKFSSVSSLGFACCLVRRSIFKTSDLLVLQMDISRALWDSLLRCDQVLELSEEGGNTQWPKEVMKEVISPILPQSQFSMSQLCGSFLHAWVEPWRLSPSSNASGLSLLFGQNT